jgi:energy-coupling factor transporter ATP-binding protein EcfA2
MRLQNCILTNYLTHHHLNLALGPVSLITGSNGAGKTSVLEAIRMVLTGADARVAHKKDYPLLITNGAKTGAIRLTWEDQDGSHDSQIDFPSGKRSGTGADATFLEYALGTKNIADIKEKDMKALVYRLSHVQITTQRVTELLAESEVGPALAKLLLPSIRAGGFTAGEKEAKEMLRVRKGVWEEITGEDYGKVKAEDWRPDRSSPVPVAPSAAVISAAENALTSARIALEKAIENMGKAKGHALPSAARLAELSDKAATLPTLQGVLSTQEAGITVLETDVALLQQDIAAAQNGHHVTCPHCQAALVYEDGELLPNSLAADHLVDVSDRQQRLDTATTKLVALRNKSRDTVKAIAVAEQAVTILSASGDSVDLTLLQENVAKRRTDVVVTEQALADLQKQLLTANQSSSQEERAKKILGQIQQLEHAVTVLAPDGIPARFLSAALEPFNTRLSSASTAAHWPLIQLTPEMRVTWGGRPYALCSESEQWRVNAVLAVVLAEMSEIGFVLLDRFDVLEPKGRANALRWLTQCSLQVILAGTAKEKPNLPNSVQVIWLDTTVANSVAA